jgi:two-component system, cell cycle sensor histidine kinase and response regulator CckA
VQPPRVSIVVEDVLGMKLRAVPLEAASVEVECSEDRYRTLFSQANDVIAFLTPTGAILEANQRWKTLLGIEPEAMVGRHIRDLSPPGAAAEQLADFERTLAAGSGKLGAVPLLRADGSSIVVEFSLSAVELGGQSTILAIGRDVTVEVLARRALATAEERYRTLVERIPDVVWTGTSDQKIAFVTPNVARVLGYTRDELNAQSATERAEMVHPEDRGAVTEATRAAAEEQKPFDLEYRIRHKDGRFVWVRSRLTATFERDGVRYVEGMVSDINERKVLEESFRQAQKMEAIGQLTGGIAHDFNNLLAAILANSHFLLENLGEQDPRRADADEIRQAAERASALTRQLLAFSRRQVLEPAILNLNDVVAGIEKMLCRLISEDITLTVAPGADLGTVKVDRGQLEQVIMNLVVNARDAMPNGGTLSIETSTVDFDDDYAASHAPVVPGRYVMLAVSDTGCGMDEATQLRLFEPFFTTKEVGKGTGLGLSTCYGIVKQSGGYIWVYSEPGRGSVFKIYLPRVELKARRTPSKVPRKELGGTETVLLVEDDSRVREAVARMLSARGYRPLVARDGAEATRLLEGSEKPIDLLLTDVVMPTWSGPELAEQLCRHHPVKVLFMSGYTDHAVLRAGVLRPGHGFIQKPFSPDSLAKKLREVLDA